jgi:signal transduction histidine kinase
MTDLEDRELVDDLLGETDQMNAVLSDLLLLARLDSGKLTVAEETFNLASVVSETAERFGARAGAEEVRLDVHNTGKISARGPGSDRPDPGLTVGQRPAVHAPGRQHRG